jgi:hypothetical protein
MFKTALEPKAWLAQGKITCPDVAAMWGSKIGDVEFRLLDHPDKPSSSHRLPKQKRGHDLGQGNGNKNYYPVTVYYKTPSGRDSSYYWGGPNAARSLTLIWKA